MSNGTAADLEPPLSREQLLLIAPIFVGCLLSYLLMGVSIAQLYIYHVSYAADSRIIRYSVYGIFIADIAQSVAVAGHGYGTLVEQWGRPKAGALMYWWNGPMPILSSTLALWCQTFYAWRIRQLGRWTVVPAIILFLSLAQTGAAYAIGTVAPSLTKGSELHRPNMTARTIIWLAGGALSDVMIMLSMVFLLLSTRSNGFILRRSELLINRLLRISVETGCFCAITAMLELITFLALPDTSLHFVFSFMLGKVYANTLMASLNSRKGPAPWTRDGRRYDSQGVSLPQFQNTSSGTSDSQGDSEGVVFTTVLDISRNGVSSAGHSEDKAFSAL